MLFEFKCSIVTLNAISIDTVDVETVFVDYCIMHQASCDADCFFFDHTNPFHDGSDINEVFANKLKSNHEKHITHKPSQPNQPNTTSFVS